MCVRIPSCFHSVVKKLIAAQVIRGNSVVMLEVRCPPKHSNPAPFGGDMADTLFCRLSSVSVTTDITTGDRSVQAWPNQQDLRRPFEVGTSTAGVPIACGNKNKPATLFGTLDTTPQLSKPALTIKAVFGVSGAQDTMAAWVAVFQIQSISKFTTCFHRHLYAVPMSS